MSPIVWPKAVMHEISRNLGAVLIYNRNVEMIEIYLGSFMSHIITSVP